MDRQRKARKRETTNVQLEKVEIINYACTILTKIIKDNYRKFNKFCQSWGFMLFFYIPFNSIF